MILFPWHFEAEEIFFFVEFGHAEYYILVLEFFK